MLILITQFNYNSPAGLSRCQLATICCRFSLEVVGNLLVSLAIQTSLHQLHYSDDISSVSRESGHCQQMRFRKLLPLTQDALGFESVSVTHCQRRWRVLVRKLLPLMPFAHHRLARSSPRMPVTVGRDHRRMELVWYGRWNSVNDARWHRKRN